MKKIISVLLVLNIALLGFTFYEEYNLYFGNLHSHTEYSDGVETPETALEYANDFIDFMAITDHAHYFSQELPNGKNKYDSIIEECKTLTTDTFLGIPGFEWTASGPGHINFYDVRTYTDRNIDPNLVSLYEWVNTNKPIGQFNHPISMFGNFDDCKYYPYVDKYMNLFEIGNGNWYQNQTVSEEMLENFALALNNGWHVGTTIGQDNHKANWGSANDSRTAIYSKSLAAEDIYHSMKNMLTYGTEDKNLILKFWANDVPAGSIIYDPSSVKFNIELIETQDDKIETVYIYDKNGIYDEIHVDSNEFKYNFEIEPESGYEFYYLIIKECDGERAVSTPIWLQSSNKTYLLNLKAYPKSVKSGEFTKLFFDLINMNMEEKLLNLSIKNDTEKTILSKDYNLKGESISYESIEIPVKEEKMLLYIDGIFYSEIKIKIMSKDSLNIIIDKTHYNYGENYRAQFIEEMSNRGNQVSYLEKMIKKDSLDKANVFIIPLPGEEGTFDKMKMLHTMHYPILETFIKSGGTLIMIGNPAQKTEEIVQSYNDFLVNIGVEDIFDESGKMLNSGDTEYMQKIEEGKIILLADEDDTKLIEILNKK